jgi:hypothetical protein
MSFENTRKALERYEEIYAEEVHMEPSTALAWCARVDEARCEIGEAFFLDTAEYNRIGDCIDFAMCGCGLEFMRTMAKG